MIKYDIHTHSEFSADSEESILNHLDACRNNKLTGICITDHMDYEFEPFLFDVNDYFNKLNIIKKKPVMLIYLLV